jgi:putative two-component system response regulator
MRNSTPEELRGLRILILDDEDRNIDVLQRLLVKAGHGQLQCTTDPRQALTLLRERLPDLILLDLHMPGMDGFEVMAAVRKEVPEGTYLPILVLTGDLEPDTRQRALSVGATDFVTKPFEATEVLLRIRNLLMTRHLHLRLQRHNEELEEKVRLRTMELEEAQAEIISRLALAAEYRDDLTGQHAKRVGTLSGMLAMELGLDPAYGEILERAAPLHDVGKIGIPDSILLKKGGLTDEEFCLMRTHIDIGARILGGSRFDLLRLAREIALSHHEKWDGTGYRGLAGDAIPISGRIVAVADVFDCLSHERPYKAAFPFSRVLDLIVVDRGRHFDPDVVDALLRLVERGNLHQAGLVTGEGWAAATIPDAAASLDAPLVQAPTNAPRAQRGSAPAQSS